MSEYVSRKEICEKTGIKRNSLRQKLADLGIPVHHSEVVKGKWTSFYNSNCIPLIKKYVDDIES